ncbi:bifunctional hydroxymethylpyrimidine kinase/phosphomethylpyrimidine kinase [Thermoanaerobacterium sp. DL9XJH110]|uniref:bifunctional hydroxymethylpyrimidine kinase/phosphomethylpyrimidine kinase n=1 Tax=Thermoanaerobacterium sp. DL9XJH110 TaxID=3386643 RepID=UPI003BB53E4E
MKKILTIAGSDSIGGAGIQADIKTFCALGVYGMSVITAVTAQNTMGVFDVRELDQEIIRGQIDRIFEDVEVDAVKIGMVSSSTIIETVASSLKSWNAKNIVLDPVMISKSGYYLLKKEAIDALKENLVPLADVVTPNIPEAEELTGMKIATVADMKEAAKRIIDMGPKSVVVKGGHMNDDAANVSDVFYDGKAFKILSSGRIVTGNTHGTGCTYSAAIASYLGRGFDMEQAVKLAKKYITEAIKNSLSLGKGAGPVGHLVELYKKAGIRYE